MIVPEVTYGFSALKDVSGSLVSIVTRRASLTDTDAQLDSEIYEVPADNILIVSALSVSCIPGATQTAIRTTWGTRAEAGSLIDFLARGGDVDNQVADIRIALSYCGEVWVAPGEVVYVRSTFDAGTNANQHVVGMNGLLIPRGNIQQA